MKKALLALMALTTCVAAETDVNVGALTSQKTAVAIPQESLAPLQTYFDTLVASKPLPWPFDIESAVVTGNMVAITGRLLRPGAYELPLGVFSQDGHSCLLPTLFLTGVPVAIPQLSPSDMLLPFPDIVLYTSDENLKQQRLLLDTNQLEGVQSVLWQEALRHTLYVVCFALVCAPFAFQCRRWWKARKKPVEALQIVTPETVLQEIKALRQKGQTPWPKLLYALNLIDAKSPPSLTSYELRQSFAQQGKPKLEQAAATIELYGYVPGSEAHFDEVMSLVEQAASLSYETSFKNRV